MRQLTFTAKPRKAGDSMVVTIPGDYIKHLLPKNTTLTFYIDIPTEEKT